MPNVPNIRFKGFKDAWEQRKCGEVLSESREQGHSGDKAKKLTVKLWGKGVVAKDDKGSAATQYFIRHAGQFIYSKLDFLNSAFGVIPEELEGYETTADLPAFDCHGINPYFMFYRAIQQDFYYKNGSIADGSRKAKRIHADTFLEMPIQLPSIEEQNRIVTYLHQLDNLITLHQHKREENILLKKYMLKKMFPLKGEVYPEIRFDNFTDAWEQRKLEKVAKYRNGRAHENEIDVDGKYIVVNSKFVSTDGGVRKFSNIQNEPLYENEIAFVLSDVPNGRAIARTFLVDKSNKYTLNQRIAGITPLDETDPYYLYIKMNRNPYFLKFDDGNKQTNLSINDVMGYEDMYPTYDEQKKIGEFFRSLDNLITLHQQKCEELKALKKYMLQNMFVK